MFGFQLNKYEDFSLTRSCVWHIISSKWKFKLDDLVGKGLKSVGFIHPHLIYEYNGLRNVPNQTEWKYPYLLKYQGIICQT